MDFGQPPKKRFSLQESASQSNAAIDTKPTVIDLDDFPDDVDQQPAQQSTSTQVTTMYYPTFLKNLLNTRNLSNFTGNTKKIKIRRCR